MEHQHQHPGFIAVDITELVEHLRDRERFVRDPKFREAVLRSFVVREADRLTDLYARVTEVTEHDAIELTGIDLSHIKLARRHILRSVEHLLMSYTAEGEAERAQQEQTLTSIRAKRRELLS